MRKKSLILAMAIMTIICVSIAEASDCTDILRLAAYNYSSSNSSYDFQEKYRRLSNINTATVLNTSDDENLKIVSQYGSLDWDRERYSAYASRTVASDNVIHEVDESIRINVYKKFVNDATLESYNRCIGSYANSNIPIQADIEHVGTPEGNKRKLKLRYNRISNKLPDEVTFNITLVNIKQEYFPTGVLKAKAGQNVEVLFLISNLTQTSQVKLISNIFVHDITLDISADDTSSRIKSKLTERIDLTVQRLDNLENVRLGYMRPEATDIVNYTPELQAANDNLKTGINSYKTKFGNLRALVNGADIKTLKETTKLQKQYENILKEMLSKLNDILGTYTSRSPVYVNRVQPSQPLKQGANGAGQVFRELFSYLYMKPLDPVTSGELLEELKRYEKWRNLLLTS